MQCAKVGWLLMCIYVFIKYLIILLFIQYIISHHLQYNEHLI